MIRQRSTINETSNTEIKRRWVYRLTKKDKMMQKLMIAPLLGGRTRHSRRVDVLSTVLQEQRDVGGSCELLLQIVGLCWTGTLSPLVFSFLFLSLC